MPPNGDEPASFSFSPSMIPHYSTQDLCSILADPAAQQIPPPNSIYMMEHGIVDYGFMFHDTAGSSLSHLPGPESPLIDLDFPDDFFDFLSPPDDAPEDGRPCSTDADMLGVNDTAAPQAAPLVRLRGGGHVPAPCCATASSTTEIQHHHHLEEEEEEAQRQRRRFDSLKSDVKQRLLGEDGPPLTVSDEKLVAPAPAPAPAPEDGGRPAGRDGDIAVVNAAAIEHVEEDQRRFGSFKSSVLTEDELMQLTNNFSPNQLIGKGALGEVYKVVLPNGDTIAVKRFAPQIPDVQFEKECQHLMSLQHPNIARIVGYSSKTEKSERFLFSEYMPKGSLRDHISDETSGLEWNTRYQIIGGICKGLRYLRGQQDTPMIHMDLKPENILLDNNMVPKIADFGLSRLFGADQTRTCTTSYKATPDVITLMSDVYSFGVLIIEILTGRKDFPTDETETTSQQYIENVLNNWRRRARLNATPALPCPAAHQTPRTLPSQTIENRSPTIASQKLASVDPVETWPGFQTRSSVNLLAEQGEASFRPTTKHAPWYTSQDIEYQQIKKLIQIGLLCVNSDPAKRPTVNEIIEMVETSDEAYQNEREVAPPDSERGDEHLGPWCAMACRTEIQHLEEDAQRRLDSWKLSDDEQRLLGEVDPLTVPDEKLAVEARAPAPAPEDGRPSGRDTDMAEVNAAATEKGGDGHVAGRSTEIQQYPEEEEEEDAQRQRRFDSWKSDNAAATETGGPPPVPIAVGVGEGEVLEEEAQRRRLSSFMSVVKQDLLPIPEGHKLIERVNSEADRLTHVWLKGLPERYDMSTDDTAAWSMSVVQFTGPDPKGKKHDQGGWKEKSMKGMSAVSADASCVMQQHLVPVHGQQQQQQRYLGLKKTLELDDDGNGNRKRAYEYTPLLPSDDGTNKLVPAVSSLRIEFKENEPPSSSSPPPSSFKRSITGDLKDGPKIPTTSEVWDHMTRLHVKVTPKDGSKRKKPYYKGMYAICHHCHQVFNADPKQGTNNQSEHLKSCKCNCTRSHSVG